jgi:hypothetical protein
MLLHPRKALPEVLQAIREVEHMLQDEKDQKVVAVMNDIVNKIKQHVI